MVAALYRRGADGVLSNIYMSSSVNGIDWEEFTQIVEDVGEHFYPSIIGKNGNALRKIDGSFYVYYTYSVQGTWNRWNDAVLRRVWVSVR
jgi:hypothetical protein